VARSRNSSSSLNELLRSHGLTYAVDFQTNSNFYEEARILVTCEAKQSHNVAMRIVAVLRHYAQEGFSESEVEYANNIALRKKILVTLTKEMAHEWFKSVFWDVASTIVILVPEPMKEIVEDIFKEKKENSYFDIGLTLSCACVVVGAVFAAYYQYLTKRK